MKPRNSKLRIVDLLLDQENPRFIPVENQREAIHAMLEEQGLKIYALASDIVKHGLDPSKRLIVFKEKGKYVDGDGNRRLTALKILETPDLIRDTKLHQKFKKLSQDLSSERISEVDCVVFKSREFAKHWIEINHGGELDGRGQIPWSSEQKERFNGAKSIGLAAKDSLLSKGLIKEDELDLVNITTLNRLLESRPGKIRLAITKEKGRIIFGDMPSLLKVFTALKGKSVVEVYHDGHRKRFLDDCLKSLEECPKEKVTITQDVAPKPEAVDNEKRTPRVRLESKPIFGESLCLKSGRVNNIYRDICDIYEMRKRPEDFVEILGFSLRLILDVAASKYFDENPREKQKSESVYRDYFRLMKGELPQIDKDTLSLDPTMSSLIEEEKVEALLAKLAHGSIRPSIKMILDLSFIIAPILKLHFSKKDT